MSHPEFPNVKVKVIKLKTETFELTIQYAQGAFLSIPFKTGKIAREFMNSDNFLEFLWEIERSWEELEKERVRHIKYVESSKRDILELAKIYQ